MALTELSRSIEGMVAIVTGASSGMGAATAKLFAAQGAKVAAVDINQDGLAAVVDEINGAGKTAHGWTLDLSDGAAIDGVIGEVAAHFGAPSTPRHHSGWSLRKRVSPGRAVVAISSGLSGGACLPVSDQK